MAELEPTVRIRIRYQIPILWRFL